MIYDVNNQVEESIDKDVFPTFTEVVGWPEIQDLQDKENFRFNAALINGRKGIHLYGCSAYRVNPEWLAKVKSGEIVDVDDNDYEEFNPDELLVDYTFSKKK